MNFKIWAYRQLERFFAGLGYRAERFSRRFAICDACGELRDGPGCAGRIITYR